MGGQRQSTDRDLQQGGVDGQPEGQRLGVLSGSTAPGVMGAWG